MRYWCPWLLIAAVVAGPAGSRSSAQPSPTANLLDRYLRGEFEAVATELAVARDLDALLKNLMRDGRAWIDAGPADQRARRQLAAATFALEAARAAEQEEWKWVQRISGVAPTPPPALWWKSPPQAIEWACATIRESALPRATERAWHLAAIAVAQRRSDYEFLIGSPWAPRGDPGQEINHLTHAVSRFPDEPRFALAQAIAIEWSTWPLTAKHPRTTVLNPSDAIQAFERQTDNPTTGAEATVRLGVLRLRTRNPGAALELFERAETLTRDRYLIYLARYFSGQARERQKRPADAERAYRGALATIPQAISATMALAAVLAREGRTSEASALVEAALTANPTPVDPWRTYAAADDRFWPQLIARLHAEIQSGGAKPDLRPFDKLRVAPSGVEGRQAQVAPSESRGAPPYDPHAGAKTTPRYETPGPADAKPASAYDRDDDGGDEAEQAPQQQPVFRARTDLVTIDVSVRSQGEPAAGLTAKDFVLLDNGVPQTIEQIEMEAVPVDVSILVDMNVDLADDMRTMSGQLPRIMTMLRPDDRVRVTAINTHPMDLIPAMKADLAPTPGRLVPSGLSSAHDGLAAALLREVDPNRRHLVIALTNGIDAVSALDARAVRDIARHSSATLYLAQVDIAFDESGAYRSTRQRLDEVRCVNAGICSPTTHFWQPHGEYDFDILGEAADLTGGKLYLPGIFTDRTAAAIFKKVFEDYRRSYLLRYAPQGIPTPGWHEVTVTIPGHPNYEVRARRGYFVETTGRAPAASTAASPAAPRGGAPASPALADLIRSYALGDFAAFVSRLEQTPNRADLIRDYQASGNPWPDRPNRESAFVLELADAAMQSPRRADRDAGRRLIAAHRPLVRGPFGPEAYEKYWLWSAILVLEGANQPDAARQLVDDALKVFPNEPRFVLARAFVVDQMRAIETLVGRDGSLPPAAVSHVKDVSAAYDAAARFPETAAEARIRKAWLLHRVARRAEALALLDEASALTKDPFLIYLQQLFRGRILDGLGRLDESVDAYRAALTQVPDAQSARVGLMVVRQRLGDRAGALVWAEAIQSAPVDTSDPWWRYWQGDYRLMLSVFTRLREHAQ